MKEHKRIGDKTLVEEWPDHIELRVGNDVTRLNGEQIKQLNSCLTDILSRLVDTPYYSRKKLVV